jgi:hypothetical protein
MSNELMKKRLNDIEMIKNAGKFLIDNCDKITAIVQAVEYTTESENNMFVEDYHGSIISRLGLSYVIKNRIAEDFNAMNEDDCNETA